MTLDEKLLLIGGTRGFFTREVERLGIREVFMADASQGINIRHDWLDEPMTPCLEKSVAFPSMSCLAASWNPQISEEYARSVGEEARAGGVGILLGPGMNIYRHSQSGRNFEYLGEDPYLAARMIERFVKGVQSNGVVATIKHFITNNTDYFRRKSNSVVDDRALREIYLPAFKAGVEAGAKAVMTAYNQFNGEWCSQNRELITGILREELGFQWLVMTDWWAIEDAEATVHSGQDLEMPASKILQAVPRLLDEGKIKESEIDRMVISLVKTCIAMNLYDSDFKKNELVENLPAHEEISRKTVEEGAVLLKNNDLLPLDGTGKILVCGKFLDTIPKGGGAAEVEGFNHISLRQALESEFPGRLHFAATPTSEDLSTADTVLVSTGTLDSEGWDRAFELTKDDENLVSLCCRSNKRTLVLVNSGGGIRMTSWADDVAAILYGWYPGQNGYAAIAGIISGRLNPSGRLPITIEKEFSDSPGYGYIPEGEELYRGWNDQEEHKRDVYDIEYKEGVFVGYRWYQQKNIEPLFPFGFGISYSSFEISNAATDTPRIGQGESARIRCTVKNTAKRAGKTVVQLYVSDQEASVARPPRELKAFSKLELEAGEEREIDFTLPPEAFMFYSTEQKRWVSEAGSFTVYLAFDSTDDSQQVEITLV
ncbi:Beta-glucosidase [Salinispira pacifica]|uniref:Beta-glucosidase n=2 Tax=Salinispira pacifica TaxID=1307761 RepID=V5WFB0_9SPIO|nr:Beta-glucosidase [Salinispira pacifica]